MDRELARKRPAQVVKNTGYPIVGPGLQPGQGRITHVYRTAVTNQVRVMCVRGQIKPDYVLTKEGPRWVATVTFLPRRSWLRRHGLKLAVGGGMLVAFLAGLAWAVSALVAAVAAALPIVGGALVLLTIVLALAAVASGGRVIEVVQKVKIR